MEEQHKELFSNSKILLPNNTAVFVLGICSILFSCFVIGAIIGIIGLMLSREGRSMYRQNPQLYEGYGLLNAGFILSIVGTCIGCLSIFYYVWIILMITHYPVHKF